MHFYILVLTQAYEASQAEQVPEQGPEAGKARESVCRGRAAVRAGAQRRQLGVSTRMFEWLPTTNNKQISSHGNAAAAVDVDAEEQRPNKQAARTTLTTFT